MSYVKIAVLGVLLFLSSIIVQAQEPVETYRLIRFGSISCPPCKLQNQVYDDGGIAQELKLLNIRGFYYDVTVGNNHAYAKKFKLTYTPSAFLCAELPNGRLRVIKKWGGEGYGLMTAEQFKTFVNPNKPGPDPVFIRQLGVPSTSK